MQGEFTCFSFGDVCKANSSFSEARMCSRSTDYRQTIPIRHQFCINFDVAIIAVRGCTCEFRMRNENNNYFAYFVAVCHLSGRTINIVIGSRCT